MEVVRRALDLDTKFVFYASYHNNRVNVGIHLVCIWPLLATALLLLQMLPAAAPAPDFVRSLPHCQHVTLNPALLVALVYAGCYLAMEPFAGGLGALLVLWLFMLTSHVAAEGAAEGARVAGLPLWGATALLHVLGWILQFIGHGVFEGRAPALLKSLDQALLMAPLFVLLEFLFFFGYRPTLQARLTKEVVKSLAKLEAEDKKNARKWGT